MTETNLEENLIIYLFEKKDDHFCHPEDSGFNFLLLILDYD